MLLRLATGIVLFASFLPCQGGEERATEEAPDARKVGRGGDVSRAGKGEEGEFPENLTPEQRLARNVTHGAQAHCRFLASMKPAKLMPGESGLLQVTALLQGHSVLPAPAPLEFVGQAQQGLVTLAPTAKVGEKHPVVVDMRFDIYDGNLAQPVGRFLDRASTEIEVGRVANPPVAGGAATKPAPAIPAGATEPAAAEPKPPAVSSATDGTTLRGNAIEVKDAPPVAAPARTEEATRELPPVAEEGMPTLLILTAAGALVLGIVVLLARKR